MALLGHFRGLLTGKRNLIRQQEAEHLRLLQPSAFHVNPGLGGTTCDMVNTPVSLDTCYEIHRSQQRER